MKKILAAAGVASLLVTTVPLAAQAAPRDHAQQHQTSRADRHAGNSHRSHDANRLNRHDRTERRAENRYRDVRRHREVRRERIERRHAIQRRVSLEAFPHEIANFVIGARAWNALTTDTSQLRFITTDIIRCGPMIGTTVLCS